MPEVRPRIDDFFDRGIDRITDLRKEPAATALPGLQALTPTDPGQHSALDRLLGVHSFENDLQEALRPVCEDRRLLLPRPFTDALTSAVASLRSESNRLQGTHSRQAAVLDRAAQALAQELELRVLAQMYFAALYPA